MILDSCIIFESMSVANLATPAIPRVWWQKSSSLTPLDNVRQAYLVGLTAPQTKLVGTEKPAKPKSWVWQVPNLDGVTCQPQVMFRSDALLDPCARFGAHCQTHKSLDPGGG
jgi:hypothetical protein